MPAMKEAIHIKFSALGVATEDTMAGPGQMPAKPQPAPNNTPPNSRGLSILVFDEKSNELYEHAGRRPVCAPMTRMPIIVTAIAPPMTNINEGSKDARVTLRNPDTLAGDIIPLTASPRPNVNPAAPSTTTSIACRFAALGPSFPSSLPVLIARAM